MHFFELAGPDLLLGFDADPAIRNVVGLIGADPGLTVKAVNLRKFGQEIIRILGGRRVHPNFAVPGGVNKVLNVEERDAILSGVDEAINTIQLGIRIMKDWAEKHREDIEKFAVFQTGYLGYRARIRNHGHSCFLCEIVIRSQFHTTYEPEA
jgi:Coenzyme F420-reducing hydrogenase, alpha subunit